MYSKSNPPQWASRKSAAVQKRAIEVFNQTFKETGSEEKARIASLAAMKNAETEFKRRVAGIKKSLNTKDIILDIIKSSKVQE